MRVCHVPLTLEHVLVFCTKYAVHRKNYFRDCDTLEDVFNSVNCFCIVEFIKEIGIYRKI